MCIRDSGSCSGPVLGTGTSALFATTGITAIVPEDTATALHAAATDAAGNVSVCSAAFTYTEDSTGPGAPSITGTDPAVQPSDDPTPRVIGTAEADSIVTIYAGPDCSSPLETGGAAAFAAGIVLTAPLPVGITNLHALAIDAAGNDSLCSGPFPYEVVLPPP